MHTTGNKYFMRYLKLSPSVGYLTYVNNSNSQIWGYGILINGNFSVSNVAYVADLKHNLISVAQLTDANRRVEFCKKHDYAMSEDRKECLIKSNRNKDMYPLEINLIIVKSQLCLLLKEVPDVSWFWHQRLSHLNFWYMNDLVSNEMIKGLPLLKFKNNHLCATSKCGKQ